MDPQVAVDLAGLLELERARDVVRTPPRYHPSKAPSYTTTTVKCSE